ncbi:McrC family protein [Mycolicibacterium sp. PAM1]|uniref:McrBC 5-methylcytosine restriction system component-like protein n=1 Tax=Mycolicibacterium gilvum (strain PYR-GCK) TaxID=350054 RepID=A4TAT5_MYCGI|nr:McrBC 5-methylcytosine restriction system component-like protein [Mycolicibacterium sp. PAM1]ABP45674.1 McrBC 5-methylcytosine restriction system component-like protein [Mycolicibacterium gilvum PYR-GCK]MBV5246742.1 McrC family protein [Mycolicibacterium sp. PAM1]
MQTIDLVEYESRRVRTAAPTSDDLILAERLAAAGDIDAHLEVRWLADGRIDVQASSWVGVVRFSSVEIRVVPKLVGGTLRVLQMIEYSEGVRLLAHLPPDQQLAVSGDDLFQLLVRVLVGESKLLIRDGLLRDYRPTEDTLAVMRGRLRMRDQFLKRYGSLHRLECNFDEYDGDIAENQLLAASLTAAASHVRASALRNETRMLAGVIGDICQPPTFDPDWYEQRIHYGRRNSRYEGAHKAALLVLRGLALNDLHSASRQGVNAFMVNMNVIFERFVSALVDQALSGTGLRSTPQLSIRAIVVDESTNRTYSNIRPDLVITEVNSARSVPVDIKYKLYDTVKFSSADVYQLFTYAYALGAGAEEKMAGVIYASTTTTSGPALRIKGNTGIAAARLRGAGLDVAAALDNIASGDPTATYCRVRAMLRNITGLAIVDPTDRRANSVGG